MRSSVPDTCGKLWELPVHPLSRSVPVVSTVMATSRGPPAVLAGHWPAPVFGTQRRTSASASRFGLAFATAASRSLESLRGLGASLPLTELQRGERRRAARRRRHGWGGRRRPQTQGLGP